MPHYYFHLREGDRVIEDPDGGPFRDLDAARSEALASAREMLAERLKAGRVLDGQEIEICDAEGHRLATVRFREAFTLLPH
jgi:hypothetical protein